jgi:HK97 gp10 family phage protein
MGSPLYIKGLDQLNARLKDLSHDLKEEIDAEMSASATNIAKAASAKAPKGRGKLGGAVKEDITQPFSKKIVVHSNYAAFQEFGTGKKVSVPAGFEAVASGFKKKMDGATFAKFVENIEGWMKRKGITAATLITQVKSGARRGQFKKVGGDAQKAANKHLAYIIAINILKNGLKPQPFLIPAFLDEKPKLIKKINQILKQE